MRDIQMVLERWGAWAASGNAGVDYSPIAAGFKGLLLSLMISRLTGILLSRRFFIPVLSTKEVMVTVRPQSVR